MIVAIASGKGGTGKTTVAVNLALVVRRPVRLLDCDVEEPNVHLFLDAGPAVNEPVGILVPVVDPTLCDGCGECSRFCRYHAIVVLKERPLVFPEMCHGCGGCLQVCPQKAIHEVVRRIGVVRTSQAGRISLVQGSLDVGVALAPPLIREVQQRIQPGTDTVIDAPPGTSCPMIVTVRRADVIVLVTEPTPFGLHDLTLAVETVRELGRSFVVVVNREGVGDDRVHRYCRQEGIPIVLEIPDDRRIAETYSRGERVVDRLPEYRSLFRQLAERLGLGIGPEKE
ncbi:MAG TPA: ATP-binding protein [Candidatus Aminicenantes bacterium]|nr:ATP-binding protein [Candidatus Aminicenantes bacterium]